MEYKEFVQAVQETIRKQVPVDCQVKLTTCIAFLKYKLLPTESQHFPSAVLVIYV